MISNIYCWYSTVCSDLLHEDSRVKDAGGPTYNSSEDYDQYATADQGELFKRYHDDNTQNYGVWSPKSSHKFTWLEVSIYTEYAP